MIILKSHLLKRVYSDVQYNHGATFIDFGFFMKIRCRINVKLTDWRPTVVDSASGRCRFDVGFSSPRLYRRHDYTEPGVQCTYKMKNQAPRPSPSPMTAELYIFSHGQFLDYLYTLKCPKKILNSRVQENWFGNHS